MVRRSLLLLFLILKSFTLVHSQYPLFEWVHTFGCEFNNESPNDITIDQVGNIYITGDFGDTIRFNPALGLPDLIAFGPSPDLFILKYNQSGDILWAKSIGGNGSEVGEAIAADSSGNVYIGGRFAGTTDFDPNSGIYNISTNSIASDAFLLKLDTSGNFIWAKSFEGKRSTYIHSIVTDFNNNIYVTGRFNDTVDFDPGNGVKELMTVGEDDIFVLKLNPIGDLLWVNSYGSIKDDIGLSLAVGKNNELYISGFYGDTIDFDPGPQINQFASKGNRDIFIQKLDSAGNLDWIRTIGSDSIDYTNSITLDPSENLLVSGKIVGIVDFDPGAGTSFIGLLDKHGSFLLKLDKFGNFIWANAINGPGGASGRSVVSDETGNSYLAGVFAGTVYLNPANNQFTTISRGYDDHFIQKLDPDGNFKWGIAIGDISHEQAINIAYQKGEIYIAGDFGFFVDFDPGSGIQERRALGIEDNFLLKLSQMTVGQTKIEDHGINLYPNPSIGEFVIDLGHPYKEIQLTITNSLGGIISTHFYREILKINTKVGGPNGIYFIELRDNEGMVFSKKIIKAR